MEIMQFEFFRNAIYAAFLAGAACGIIGVFVVIRRLVSISGGIAHSAFGGIGLGYLLGINPLVAVMPFTILTALGIGFLSKKTKLSEDTAIGIFWSLGMALGVIFIGLAPGYVPDLFGYLFGNILAVSASDLKVMLVLDIFIGIVVVLYFRQLQSASFDQEFSKVRNLNTGFLHYLLLVLVAVSVVVLIRVAGIILVIALLTIPAAIARQYTSSLIKMILIAMILGILLTILGLFVSYGLNLSSGAVIIILSVLFLGLSSIIRKISGKGN